MLQLQEASMDSFTFLPAHFQNQSKYFKLPSCLLPKLQVLSIQVERILSQSSLKTCSCSLLRYFGMILRYFGMKIYYDF